MTKEEYIKKYSCPNCGILAPEFDGTFYKVVDGEYVFDLSDWDLMETGLPLSEEYYPKIKDGKETHLCPKCGKEFTFINSTKN